jgi:hypothetical protein
MPKIQKRTAEQSNQGSNQGIVRDNKGQEQPADKERARQVSREDRGDDPPGHRD